MKSLVILMASFLVASTLPATAQTGPDHIMRDLQGAVSKAVATLEPVQGLGMACPPPAGVALPAFDPVADDPKQPLGIELGEADAKLPAVALGPDAVARPRGGPPTADPADPATLLGSGTQRYAIGLVGGASSVGPSFAGAPVLRVDPVLELVVVDVPIPDFAAFNDAVRQKPGVRYCEHDHAVRWISPYATVPREWPPTAAPIGSLAPALPMSFATATPSDPLFSSQYALNHIRAEDAWDVTYGSSSRTICIVDTGIRYTHEDLAGPRYLGGTDFVDGDADAWDDGGHGTHSAGIAAATTDNALGVAGIAQAGILAVRAVNAAGTGHPSDVASGIAWCDANGGHIILMSLDHAADYQVVGDAVSLAAQGSRLLVAGQGDNGIPTTYPAAYPEVLAVGCTDAAKAACAGSAPAPHVEVAAPGNGILSTHATADDAYASLVGVAQAAPLVAGIAALAWSLVPTLSADDVRTFLRCTAQDLGTAGFDEQFGDGLVDARAVLDAAQTGYCTCSASTLEITGYDDLLGAGEYDGPVVVTLTLGRGRTLAGASHTWTLHDANGWPGPYSVTRTQTGLSWEFVGNGHAIYDITFQVQTQCFDPPFIGSTETASINWLQLN